MGGPPALVAAVLKIEYRVHIPAGGDDATRMHLVHLRPVHEREAWSGPTDGACATSGSLAAVVDASSM